VEPGLPSPDLVRSASDERVLRALMAARRLTRAELAARTGLSRPTAGESVRRLTEAGLVADTGARTPGGRGKGRVGTYYALAPGAGTALAVSIAPDGVIAECADSYGDVIARSEQRIDRPARPPHVAEALQAAVTDLQEAAGSACRLAVVSAADPVDRTSGRLVHLPDAPFLVGELSPGELLAPRVSGPVIVDNDVNWAARAERAAAGGGLDNYAYLYLGEGLGCAIVSDGEVLRGHAGIAGEVAHVLTISPAGRPVPLTEVFAELGLRHAGSAAIDVSALLAAVAETTARGQDTRTALATAISGALAAIVAIADPEVTIIGGTWGTHPAVMDAISAGARCLRRPARVRVATLTSEPALAGARQHAVQSLRSAIVAEAAVRRAGRPATAGAGTSS
jgi:predicted NBD/HSP70 family sugar kinase